MFFISYFAAFISALLFLFFACLAFSAIFLKNDNFVTQDKDLDDRLNLELLQQQRYIAGSTKYWCLGIIFFTAFGTLGSADFDYKCKRAHEMNPKETCKMIARGVK